MSQISGRARTGWNAGLRTSNPRLAGSNPAGRAPNGNKIEYDSLPYKNITHFCVETAEHFDLDAELKIWVSGASMPIQKRFNKQLNIYEVQSVLAWYVLQ